MRKVLHKTGTIPRVAAVHDLSGFGRSSLTIVLPVLSVMGVQACPLQTALLSTQTSGFTNYHFRDLTDDIRKTISHWKELGLLFDGIYTGFLGSPGQISVVTDFACSFRKDTNSLVLVDPVLGDEGRMYGPFDDSMVSGMNRLVRFADIITPNFTEACLLLGEPYTTAVPERTIREYLPRLAEKGPETVIVTSVPVEGRDDISAIYTFSKSDAKVEVLETGILPGSYPGTGDMFASVVLGAMLKGLSPEVSVGLAADFVYNAIQATIHAGYPEREGVCMEPLLAGLAGELNARNR